MNFQLGRGQRGAERSGLLSSEMSSCKLRYSLGPLDHSDGPGGWRRSKKNRALVLRAPINNKAKQAEDNENQKEGVFSDPNPFLSPKARRNFAKQNQHTSHLLYNSELI